MRRIPPRTIERQACDLECSIDATDASAGRIARLRNLSLTGARLEGAELDGCPDAFELRIVHQSGAIETLNARVIWRQSAAVGVRFEDAKTTPRRRIAGVSRAV